MNINNLNFENLSAREKRELINTLDLTLDESTTDFSFQQKILAQTLFVARSYHFHEQFFEKISMPMPALIKDVMENVWSYLLGEISMKELEEFHKATDSVFACLLTGEDEDLDREAWEKYERECDSTYMDFCVDTVLPSYIYDQIVSNEIDWQALFEEIDSISDYVMKVEPVFKEQVISIDDEKGINSNVYDSHTFAEIFSLLQEDFRLVGNLGKTTKKDILRLHEQYQNKELFDRQNLIKIADAYLCS